ncbi:HD domain-containing protein [Catellatospora vulcania]|uniref:HD domain-containing protein n=1 Tax=Catellatospora vulcania TaxID=1460450 RepID=UPI0012D480CB|nr:metal-dependent phosphohydrolase [Catellatospora vulcania]
MATETTPLTADRFAATARAAGATGPDSVLAEVGTELINRWSEPQRHYHTVEHLAACLELVGDEPAVALAVWGHDAVYDPTAADNEERSAVLTAELLTECRLPIAVIEEVTRLVRLTAGHSVAPGDRNGALLADADLAVLAAPWPDYVHYVAAVRAEYAHVPDELWRIGRSTVLQSLLALPTLYHHTPHLESPARANLRRELSSLTPTPPPG